MSSFHVAVRPRISMESRLRSRNKFPRPRRSWDGGKLNEKCSMRFRSALFKRGFEKDPIEWTSKFP